jgi:hypothetical protein
MASRTFIDSNFSLIKRMVQLFLDISVSEAVTPVPTLQKWNYPVFGTGPTARTYTAAPSASTLPSGPGPYPLQYAAGSEGVLSIARTAVGLYTLTLQDNYQRLVGLNAFPSGAGGTPVFARVSENTTITNMSNSVGSIIGLAFWDFAALAVDPIGHVRISLVLQDATEP